MVKDKFIYLLLGDDIPAKETNLEKIKKQFLADNLKDFNFDVLYASELSLRVIQEKILFLPFEATKRVILIKQVEDLKKDIKEFLVKFFQEPQDNLIFIFDSDDADLRDEFLSQISKSANIINVGTKPIADVFVLARNIEAKKVTLSLKILRKLLEDGERPERILGGLRARWQKDNRDVLQYKRRIGLFLKCDQEIKTGKAKPSYSLEQLVVKLCCFRNFLG